MTTPPTASVPFLSKAPRLNPGPKPTVATSFTLIGVLFLIAKTTFSISVKDLKKPLPRTINSLSPSSTTSAPTSILLS